MNTTQHVSRLAAFGLIALLSGTAPAVLAADPSPPPQYGPGMMGGYGGMGPGMMGYGMMGPGMMGGGYGMMGPGMMGPGMIGPGMMGGGYGMMGPCSGNRLDLTPDQQAKINKIQDETRKAHWAMMGEMMDQQAKLRDLNLAPKRDNAAIDAVYKDLGKLRQQMYDSAVAAHQRMETILTKKQQDKLRN